MIVEDQVKQFADRARRDGTTFHALLDPDRFPLIFLKDGELSGIQYDLIRKLMANSGVNIQITPCGTHEEYLKLKNNKQFDIILDTAFDFSQAETTGVRLCNSYFSTPVSLLIRKGNAVHTDKIALLSSSNLSKLLIENGLGSEKLVYFPSIKEVVEAVKQGSVDGAYLYTRTCNEVIRFDTSDVLASKLTPNLQMEYAIAVNRGAPQELFALLCHATATLSDEDIQDSVEKYEFNPTLKYTVVETIKRNPVKTVAVLLVILAIIVSGFSFILLARRKLYRNAKILEKLPLRFFVVDRKGTVLLLNTPDLPDTPCRTISDLDEPVITDIMKKLAAEAFLTGTAQVDYDYGKEKRSAVASRLPASIFGKDAVVWVSQDTTALHEARAEALDLAVRMQVNLRSIGDAVIGTDAQGLITLMNPAAEKFCGITEAEARGKKHEDCFNIVNYETGEPVDSPVRSVLATGKKVELANHTDLISLDGTRKHIADSAAPIPGQDGSIRGVILVFRDVTDEYDKRDRLRDLNESFRISADMSRVTVFYFNPVDWSISGVTSLEKYIPVKDGKLLPYKQWVFAADLEGLEQYTKEVRGGKLMDASTIFRSEYGGKVRTFRCFLRRSSKAIEEQGEELIGVIQEITEYVEQENLLSETQRMWELIGDALPIHLFAKNVDDDFRYMMGNRKFAEFVGKTSKELFGKTDQELFPRTKDSQWFENCDREIVKSGQVQQFQETVADVNGREFQLQTLKTTLAGPGGKNLLVGVSMDITEQQLLERMERARTKALEVFFSASDIQTAFASTLKILSEYSGAVFTCVLKRKNEETRDMELFSDYRVADIPPMWPQGEVIHFEPEWCDQQILLRRQGTIQCPDLDVSSKLSDCQVIKTLRLKEGIRAASMAGIFQKGNLWGELVVGFATPRNQYDQLYETFLNSFVYLLEVMIERTNMEYTVRESLTRLELASEMGRAAAFVYDLDRQKLSGSRQLSQYWPERDGQFIPFTEWVHPDYLPKCN
ncbi:MAG: PAS domain-containing protein, partial [Thermoguttaceae bacterium]|nr:PAS domain-containing protein [Thermoguttaceae bacterium]